MFCTKCGSKLSEESVFCPKCGQKVVMQQGEEVKIPKGAGIPTQISQPEEPSGQSKPEPLPEDTAGLYALLEADAETQSRIISVKQVKNVVSMRARINTYFVSINNRQVLMTSRLTFPFDLLYIVPFWFLFNIAFNMGWEFMDHNSLYFEDYALPFMLCLFTGGLIMAVTPLFGRREKEIVTEYVREIVEPRGISLVTKKMKPAVRYLLSAILILCGILVLVFGVLEVELGGGSDFPYAYDEEDSNDDYDLNRNDSISLTQTYLNEEEGFSFMYPADWKIENEEEAFSEALVSVTCTGTFGVYARIAVTKEVDGGFYFAATSSDFEELFSYTEGMSNVEIIELSDVVLDGHQARKLTIAADNDIGVQVIEICYLYIRESYVYWVICVVEEANYDRYESKFNAIMESYTITEASDSSGTRPGAEDGIAFDVSDDAAKPILVDWLQRHPLRHNLKVRFTRQAADAGDGTKYLLYEMYIDQEEYGFLGVNPDHGDIVMDSVLDGAGNWITIQTAMDDWYLVYYWGWTDDSGYYSEYYMDDVYGVCAGDGIAILNYYAESDSYVICNYDLQCLIEYDDGTAASEVDISDFAGTYSCDASIDEEGGYANYYSLEIGAWDGYYFSITESWRGMDIIHDEWASPYTLVANTLTFRTIGSNGASYEMHTLTYIPAEYSPLGRDVIYIDGDEDMPFVRE